jgi:hypothetical protein
MAQKCYIGVLWRGVYWNCFEQWTSLGLPPCDLRSPFRRFLLCSSRSETLRTQHSQSVEEQAAKTTIKLIFPLVLFIFPSLFLVTLGPALIMMSESFQKCFNQ